MARRSPKSAVAPKPAAAAPAVAPDPHWLRYVIAACSVLLFTAFCTVDVSDTDTWWHLKTGEYILQNRALPVPDPFAYTTYLKPSTKPIEDATRDFNLTHEWLSQILFYLAHAGGGFAGLVVMRASLLTAFCTMVGMAAYRRTRSFYRGLFAALGAGTVAWQFTSERPYLITFLLIVVTIVIVESGRRLWVLPPLFLVWGNLHGGFFMGWVVLGVYCAEALYLRLRGKPPARERQLWIYSIAAILASGINPNGFMVIPVMRWYRASPMQAGIWEWQYPLPWPPVPFSILLAAGLAVLVWQRRRTRPADWMLFALFGTAAMLAVRNIILAAVVGPLMLASYLPWKRQLSRSLQYAMAALLLVAAGARIATGRAYQLRSAEWKYPTGAVDFLLKHNIEGRIFNTYGLGGYLIWRLAPRQRVFIDGRALNEKVYQDYHRIAYNAEAVNGKSGEELLKEYGIEVIVMEGFEYTSGSPYLLPAALSDPKQTEWKLVYYDDKAMIYMRRPPPGVEALNSFEALAAMESQCSTFIRNDPGSPKCAGGLAALFAKIGDMGRAQLWRARAAAYQ
jgi:hypothetical protein